jgi:hypothetical protein
MIEYTYNFIDFRVIESEGDLSKVVKQINWQYIGTDGDCVVKVPFTTTLDDADPDTFTDFSSITKDQVIEWINNKVDIEHIKSNIEEEINKIKTAPTVTAVPFNME